MTAAVFALWLGQVELMILSLFLMATQSTFLSPAKYGLLPEILAGFWETLPGIEVTARVASSDAVAQLVRSREADLGFTFNPPSLDGLEASERRNGVARRELVEPDPGAQQQGARMIGRRGRGEELGCAGSCLEGARVVASSAPRVGPCIEGV